jgi:hypothetical protein
MRKIILGAAAVAGLLLLPASAAFAGGGYGSQPGYSVANSNTPCAGHGSFGAFGATGDVAHDHGVNNPGSNGLPGASNFAHPAADGETTGGNNSALCGNGATPPGHTP